MDYPDIYFTPEYAALYAKPPSQTVEQYIYRSDIGAVVNLFLKRQIELSGGEYFDIVTPYGYGGPYIADLKEPEHVSLLVQGYMEAFAEYAEANNIISEFIRFHPLLSNGPVFSEVYHSIWSRHTVGTDLTLPDPLKQEVAKHARKKIRHLLADPAIRYETDEHPESLDDFIAVYYSTMDRNLAEDKYYFGPDYFTEILRCFPENLLTIKVFLGSKLIGMGLYFRYHDVLHIHLSGTLNEYLSYSPAYLLRYALIEYGISHGYHVIHHGGGRTSAADDSLYTFKKQFGQLTAFDFYIGKRIWNERIYAQLCREAGVSPTCEYFPAYRSISDNIRSGG